MDLTELTAAAQEARLAAYVPYSKFAVGAAVLTENGTIYQGCNIENSSFPLTVCAERVAIFKAVAAGQQHIKAIAVVADTKGPVSPCGACRQVMTEFMAPDGTITMSNLHGDTRTVSVSEILPFSFFLKDDRNDGTTI
ncbi:MULTISPECIES: cytidine deaminase [Lapidilactobacillus]|uniref:Cytidine deaminase n=1 Tax=Lapidilactobacillus achengensis TaxID=2486000 RepID=A0ABW1UQJ5_9LACO|nr:MULTISPECIES: cytidine deaminase [Lapidilactobacillus]